MGYGNHKRKMGRPSLNGAPMSGAERVRKHDRAAHVIDCPPVEDDRRRTRLERDPAAWLRHYMPAAFCLPLGAGHRAMIDGAIAAATTGTSIVVAAPRGEGKSTIMRGICMYLVATGKVRFPLVAGWTHRSAGASFREWLRMLHNSDEFRADYPRLCMPFKDSIHAAALKSMTWGTGVEAEAHGRECGADIRATERVIVLPDSRGAVAAASVQGDVKGISVALPDGQIIRPDLLLLDDAQDPKRAANPTFVADVVDSIEKQWMCLSGPQSRLTVFMACTVAASGDVSEHFLTRVDFKAIRVARVTHWPDRWDEKGSPTRALWDEWHAELLDGMADGDGGLRGRRYYRAHKAGMTAGMAVSWAQRLDRKRKDPDALYSAMFDLYRIGEQAFASEYQNAPLRQGTTVYNLTPEVVASRTDPTREAFAVPPWAVTVIAGTDINHYGLHSVVVAFARDQSAAVLWYGRFDRMTVPENAPESERRRIIYEMLVAHGQEMDALTCRPSLWVIDGGYEHQSVQRYVAARNRTPQAVVARGYGFANYRPFGKNVIGTAREQCHLTQWPIGRGIAWHSDYWHEISQRGWLGSIGAPGACSLFAGHHREFCEHVCRQHLAEKLEGKLGVVWRWTYTPGRNDWGDALAMCYMGAAWQGIGTGGVVQPRKHRPRTGVTVIPL